MYNFIVERCIIKKAGKVSLEPGDLGLLYGFSLFETMLVREGRAVMIRRHLERLQESACQLHLPTIDVEILADKCLESIRLAGVVDGVLRLAVTAGPAEGGAGLTLLTVREGAPYRAEQYKKGFSLCTLSFPRNEKSPLVRHKTANYLENLLGRREAQNQGYDEGLFLNSRGHVAEGAVSNIFMVRDDELITPPAAAGLLPGIVRQLVLERAAGLGFRCREDNFTTRDLRGADECFLTNSLMGIMPVNSLDGVPVGSGKPEPATAALMPLYPPSCCGNPTAGRPLPGPCDIRETPPD